MIPLFLCWKNSENTQHALRNHVENGLSQDSNVDGCAQTRIHWRHAKSSLLAADSNCSICGEKSLILKCSIGCSLVFPNINERSDQDTKASTALWANLAAFGSHQ